MKKLYYFFLLALPMLFMVSCDDDNNLPDVDVSVKIEGAVNLDGILYAVQGDTISIESINVVNREEGKSAIITSASYSWDYRFIGVSVTPPYGADFVTTDMTVGPHLLQVECPLFAVDKSAAVLFFAYKVIIVENADEIPDGQGMKEFVVKPGIKES